VSINSSLESGFFIQNSRAGSPHFWQTPAFVYLMLRPFLVVPTEMAESAARGEATHAELISNNGQEKQVHCNAFTCVFVYLMLYLLFVVCTDVAISEVMEEAAQDDLISNQGPERHVRCKIMTYEELYLATEGFKEDLKLGEGGFGPVYKGFLDSTNQVS
jgi:hypothetical protein